jgi:hypothetical protein
MAFVLFVFLLFAALTLRGVLLGPDLRRRRLRGRCERACGQLAESRAVFEPLKYLKDHIKQQGNSWRCRESIHCVDLTGWRGNPTKTI